MIDLNKLKENGPEQRQAIIDAKNGDKIALTNLIKANEGLIISRIETLKYYLSINEFEDLFQEGRIAIIEAIKSFDFSLDTTFSTYAVSKIDKNIRRCKPNITTVYITEYKQQQLGNYNKIYNELQINLKRTPTSKELADKLNLEEQKIIELQQILTMKTINLSSLTTLEDEEEPEYYTKEASFLLDATIETEIFNKTLLNLLLDNKLSNEEIIVIILRFGLKTPTSKKYTLDEIGDLLGLTREAVRLKEKNAINKIQDNPNILHLIDYAENPSLVLRKLEIKKCIAKSPFSKKYPDFYSYFPEYTKEEINVVISQLSTYDKKFLEKLTTNRYTKEESIKLYEIISQIYNKLLNNLGRRIPINYQTSLDNITTTLPNDKKTSKRLTEILEFLEIILTTPKITNKHTFYDHFKGYDKNLVKRSLMYITEQHYKILQEKYGNNLEIECTSNNEQKNILIIKGIISRIKKIITKLQSNNQLVSNIYLYFSKYPKNLIDEAINNLSITDKNILHKRFGPDLENPYQELQLIRLTQQEYTRLSKIINLLDKNLLNQYNLTLVGDNKNIPMNIYPIFQNYDINIITYAISKLNDKNRQIIFNIFGPNLKINFNNLKEKNINPTELNYYNRNTISCLKSTISKIKKLGIDEILNKEKRKFINNTSNIIDAVNKLKVILDNTSIKEIENINNYLFTNELNFLNKVLSIDINNLNNLSSYEQLAFYGITNKIIKELNKNETISKENNSNILDCIMNNYTTNQSNLENKMILFLYLGIGGVKPVSISIISKTFNLEEDKIREIILLELNKLKNNLILDQPSYNKLIKSLKNK